MDKPDWPGGYKTCFMRHETKIINKLLSEADDSTESIAVWHCGKFDTDLLRRFKNARALRVAGWYGDSLDALLDLTQLEHVFIYMLPKVCSLDPIEALPKLRTIELNINHWADLQEVDSYVPLGSRLQLEEFRMGGLIPADGDLLAALEGPNLKQPAFPDVFSLAQLANATKAFPRFAPWTSAVDPEFDTCPNCSGEQVYLRGLYGTRKRKVACRKCNSTLIARHEAAFEEALNTSP